MKCSFALIASWELESAKLLAHIESVPDALESTRRLPCAQAASDRVLAPSCKRYPEPAWRYGFEGGRSKE